MPATNNIADVLVIGGGVAGLSTALQLATRGQQVIVLERQRLGCGSTSRAAGLLGQLAEEQRTPIANDIYMHVDRNAVYLPPKSE